MRTRFALLHVTLAALLVAAWLQGWAAILLEADRVHSAWLIGAVALVALWRGWRDDWDDAAWCADKLPVLGLIGTVLGIVLAIRDAHGLDLEQAAARLQLFAEIGNSLVANLLGIAAYAWLALVRRLCAPRER